MDNVPLLVSCGVPSDIAERVLEMMRKDGYNLIHDSEY